LGSSTSMRSSSRLTSLSIKGGKSQGRGDSNITLRLDASVTMCGIADDPLPVVLVVAAGVVACEVSKGFPDVGCAEATAAVGKGVVGLGLFSFEGTDAGGDVSELGVDVVVVADVGIDAPVLAPGSYLGPPVRRPRRFRSPCQWRGVAAWVLAEW